MPAVVAFAVPDEPGATMTELLAHLHGRLPRILRMQAPQPSAVGPTNPDAPVTARVDDADGDVVVLDRYGPVLFDLTAF
jgi:hypothetical protein